jgi:hypothetical protein
MKPIKGLRGHPTTGALAGIHRDQHLAAVVARVTERTAHRKLANGAPRTQGAIAAHLGGITKRVGRSRKPKG